MPVLTVTLAGWRYPLAYTPGPSLRDLLDEADLRVRTACLGHGACGLCRVRLAGGAPDAPTPAERLHIPAPQLAEGVRLACQVRPRHDLAVEILNPAPPSRWKSVPVAARAAPGGARRAGDMGLPVEVAHPLALAVDLGTTNIRAALVDLRRGRWLAQCRGANPQGESGADVISRLTLAVESPARAQRLAQQAVAAVGEALRELAARQGLDPRRVVRTALVGNSAMLILLSGDRTERLLDPDNWSRGLTCLPAETDTWRAAWGIHPRARVELVQPLAGFVGSDLLAGLLATRLSEGPAPALLVDFGTNSEIALWDGTRLWATSAAGGPAFEVSGYSCGMPAEAGAICRVEAGPRHTLRYTVVDDAAPRGLCGSGLVDLVARLLEQKLLNKAGRLAGGKGFALPDSGGLTLSGRDVDNLQQAKAAIATGIQVLCLHSGVRGDALARVCVAGEFGRYLDVRSALGIGLLPPVPAERFELWPEAALLGCTDFVLGPEAAARLAALRDRAKLINLATEAEFAARFVANLYLQPLSGAP